MRELVRKESEEVVGIINGHGYLELLRGDYENFSGRSTSVGTSNLVQEYT